DSANSANSANHFSSEEESPSGEEEPPPMGECSSPTETDQAEPRYLLVRDDAGLQTVLAALDDAGVVALDTETSGLDPRRDRLRLLSLALPTVDGGTFAYLVDCFAVDPAPLLERLAEHPLIIHNAAFDLAFLFGRGFAPAQPVHCTMLM